MLHKGAKYSFRGYPCDFSHPRLSFGREFESHSRKLITVLVLSMILWQHLVFAQRVVGDAQTGCEEAGDSRNVAADSRVTEGHEAKADARGD